MTVVTDTQYSFALCLTHDVDKPFKTPVHSLFYAIRDRDLRHLRALSHDVNPYWQFSEIMELEDELGVRSAFYFLNEQPLSSIPVAELCDLGSLVQGIGRYDVQSQTIANVMKELHEGGWEVGLHGSYHTADDRERLREEKRRIEDVLGDAVIGGRQHYLKLKGPETWRHHRAIGLDYDASLGSTSVSGFQDGYGLVYPFDDDFVVFPLTLMDQHLPDPGEDFSDAWSVCENLLETAEREDAVMTVLFHPRLFSADDFPGYRRIYRRLVQDALDRGAWVGAPGEFHRQNLVDFHTSKVQT